MNPTNQQPLATVLLVTYNHKNFIARCIDSVLEQETSFPFIIRILDDCSTDGTSDIIREYAAKYPDKVEHVLREKNVGFDDNTYGALCSVTTPYFAMVESDDWWCDPLKLQSAIDILEREKDCVMLGTNTRQLGNTGAEFFIDEKDVQSGKVPQKFHLVNGEVPPYLHTSSRIFRKIFDFSQYDKNNGSDFRLYYAYLDKGFCYYQDKVTSVYNCTNPNALFYTKGIRQKRLMGYIEFMKVNRIFSYKYDETFQKITERDEQIYHILKSKVGPEKAWEIMLDMLDIAKEFRENFVRVVKTHYGIRHKLVNLLSKMLGFGTIFKKVAQRDVTRIKDTASNEILIFDDSLLHRLLHRRTFGRYATGAAADENPVFHGIQLLSIRVTNLSQLSGALYPFRLISAFTRPRLYRTFRRLRLLCAHS